MQRVELACHTGYSRMNGIEFADDWVKFAKENDIQTLVITDNGNVDGYAYFQNCIRWGDTDVQYFRYQRRKPVNGNHVPENRQGAHEPG